MMVSPLKALNREGFSWVHWIPMVYHVSQSTTYSSISRANSLLFQADFLIAGNFPSK